VAQQDNETGAPQAAFLLEVTQSLLDAESKRDDSANGRGVAVVALSGVMLALVTSTSAVALKAGIDRGWRILGVVLIGLAIAALSAAAVSAIIGVLRPQRFAMLAIDEVKKFTTDEYLARRDEANREVLLMGMVDILEDERARAARKAAWLRRSYAAILVAAAALALTGAVGVMRTAGIIPEHHGQKPAAQKAGVVAPIRGTAETATSPAAHRVRGTGRR
jgi:hypothetical protein